MKPISKMVLRMYAPALLVVGGGLVAAELILRSEGMFGDVYAARLASWSFLLAILAGMLWAMHVSWRLWRWARGRELRCACGGLLSRLRVNRRGETYRKCMGCGSRAVQAAAPPPH